MSVLRILEYYQPDACACMKGGDSFPSITGMVRFFSTPLDGVLVEAEFFGLPDNFSFHGLHIHEHGNCSGDFSESGSHYNPTKQPHPFHKGDLLPVFNNRGYAWYIYQDNNLSVKEIIGRSVILHQNADDFTSQPAGNSGAKIACGVIEKV